MKLLSIFITIIFFQTTHAQSEIFGLASPIQLNIDTTIVYLEDYFTDVSAIQRIEIPEFLTQQLSADKKTLTLINNKTEVPFLSELKITTAQNTYSILLRKSKKEKINFTFNPNGKVYSKVSIVGELTGWNPNVIFMENINGVWQTEFIVNPGRYQYQIVADGKWFLDPNNKDSIDNGIGGYNSLLIAGEKNKSMFPQIILSEIKTDKAETQNFIGIEIPETAKKNVFVFWNNTSLKNTTTQQSTLTNKQLTWLQIPEQAEKIKRSFIRVYAFNQFGESNDLLIPLEYGKVITDPALLKRDDFQKTIMYFMMVDRFNNGDKTNDAPVKDSRVDARANYYGGDLAGIKQKIDEGYFQSMGFNALWISPVFQNPYNAYQEYPEPHRWFSGYHGYWPISLSQVDSRFGNNNIFKTLVDDAHQNNMSVYLDYVANHIHEQHPLWKQHPEYFSNLNLPEGRKNLRLWDEQRLTTWFEPYMPSFDHSKPEVAELCADSAMFWLKEFQLDGFRHDATKHIETDFWRLLTKKIKTEVEIPQQKNIYQIGETFGSRELIDSYIGSGLLNAQFDFNLYFDARSVFALDDVSFKRLSASLHETFDYYGWHHVMGNITGNHDMARFISYASGDLKFNENDKEAGWQRKIEVTDTLGYNKLKMLHAFNMTIPGIPIVYYGDEIGMPGANDPDNRRMMRFDSLNKYEEDVKNTVTKLAQLRSDHLALLYGDFEEVIVSDSVYIYKRQYFNDAVYVCFNKSAELQYQVLEFDKSICEGPVITHFRTYFTPYTKKFNGKEMGYKYTFQLKPYSFEIITFKN